MYLHSKEGNVASCEMIKDLNIFLELHWRTHFFLSINFIHLQLYKLIGVINKAICKVKGRRLLCPKMQKANALSLAINSSASAKGSVTWTVSWDHLF
jgi:hypothetical protein